MVNSVDPDDFHVADAQSDLGLHWLPYTPFYDASQLRCVKSPFQVGVLFKVGFAY
jgi:hypothetical protein